MQDAVEMLHDLKTLLERHNSVVVYNHIQWLIKEIEKENKDGR